VLAGPRVATQVATRKPGVAPDADQRSCVCRSRFRPSASGSPNSGMAARASSSDRGGAFEQSEDQVCDPVQPSHLLNPEAHRHVGHHKPPRIACGAFWGCYGRGARSIRSARESSPYSRAWSASSRACITSTRAAGKPRLSCCSGSYAPRRAFDGSAAGRARPYPSTSPRRPTRWCPAPGLGGRRRAGRR
jgi:hypothetical protein